MGWKDEMFEALKSYLIDNGCSVDRIIKFGDASYDSGCDTCGHNSGYYTEIEYYDEAGRWRSYTFSGEFGDLIKALTDA